MYYKCKQYLINHGVDPFRTPDVVSLMAHDIGLWGLHPLSSSPQVQVVPVSRQGVGPELGMACGGSSMQHEAQSLQTKALVIRMYSIYWGLPM